MIEARKGGAGHGIDTLARCTGDNPNPVKSSVDLWERAHDAGPGLAPR